MKREQKIWLKTAQNFTIMIINSYQSTATEAVSSAQVA